MDRSLQRGSLDNYTNLSDGLPPIGSNIEVITFSASTIPIRYPIRNYSIYRGIVNSARAGTILLNAGSTVTLVNGGVLGNIRNAIPNTPGGLISLPIPFYETYWVVIAEATHTSPVSVFPSRIGATMSVSSPVKRLESEYPISPSSVMETGGRKKTRRRKRTKRRLR